MKKTTLVIALLFAVSGMSGLVYELVWIRLLSQLLGGTTLAISTVLAAFMGGLALGSHFFGKRVDDHPSPLRLYAWLELGVAVLGALVPLAIVALTPVYIKLAAPLNQGPGLALLRILLTFVVVLPPTFLMGGTLPVLSRFLVRNQARLGSGLGLLYAVNTLGAVLGIALSGFLLIPAIGLTGSTVVAIVGNIVAGLTALVLVRVFPFAADASGADPAEDEQATPTATKAAPEAPRRPRELSPRILVLIFALSGFAALGLELYWTRALHHFLGNSTYAFSAMLTTYLTGLALGSWIGGRVADRVSSPARALGLVQVGMGLSAAATLPLIWNWLPGLDPAIINPPDWDTYLLRRFLFSFLVMALPTLLSGMTFPLVNRIGIQGLGRLGGQVGNLYFANTTGSILGSLAAGFLILPLLGVRKALLATAILSALVGLLVLYRNSRRRDADLWVGLAAVVVLVMAFAPLSNHALNLPSDTQDPADQVLFDREDPTAHTRVYRKPNGEMHMSVDGHHIGGTELSISRKEKILAHLPMALVPEPRNSLSVGLGSGVTLGSLALYDELEALTCVEIVPGVIEGAQLFAPYNHDVLDDPRLTMVQGDGIQYLLTTPNIYDVISSDSKLNPEYAGNAGLLALDYYELCRRRLADDGVMVQWLALHFPGAETQTVIRSFTRAFEHVERFWIDPNSLVLVGSPRPLVFDFDRFAAIMAEDDVRADLDSQNWTDPYVLSSLRAAGKPALMAALPEGRPNTWQRPNLEFSILREVRSRPVAAHEDANFIFLKQVWQAGGMAVAGSFDAEKRQRFLASSRRFMMAYGAGGGTNYVANGLAEIEKGIAANPADQRLISLRDMVTQELQGSGTGQGQSLETVLRQARGQMENGMADRALELVDRAESRFPDNPALILTRVQALRRLGRLEEALTICRRQVERGDDVDWLSQLSSVLGQMQHMDESLTYARRALALEPDNPVLINNLATTLGRMEKYGEAGDLFARAYEKSLHPRTAFFAAASYSRANRLEDSARWVQLCLDRELATREEFRTASHFENLRNSELWRDDWE